MARLLFANDQVVLSASRFGGLTQFGEADIVNARYANSVVATMGLKDLSPLDLQKVLAGKAASVGVTLGQYVENISGSAGRADVETMLQMIYLKLTGVRRDENPEIPSPAETLLAVHRRDFVVRRHRLAPTPVRLARRDPGRRDRRGGHRQGGGSRRR